jgi:uncharacterized spore protein YtfJ
VVGEPITLNGTTIIPLLSLGFGFGAGGGSGKAKEAQLGEGSGGGTGVGGGVKPVAVIIVDKDGVRVEQLKGRASKVFEKLVDTAGSIASKRLDADAKASPPKKLKEKAEPSQ